MLAEDQVASDVIIRLTRNEVSEKDKQVQVNFPKIAA